MSLVDFFKPIAAPIKREEEQERRFSDHFRLHTENNFPELEGVKIAIFGVHEHRRARVEDAVSDTNPIRKQLYELHELDTNISLADLGNIEQGHTVEDTDAAVKMVCEELIKQNIIPVIIGGAQDITYANYAAYESLEQTINLVTIDARLDFGGDPSDFTSRNYLNKIVLHQPNYLFNYSNIGHQRYLVDKSLLDLMEKMYFDVYRLGEIAADIRNTEPLVRNADIVSFDISAIRFSEAPGSENAGPNGIYAEQACQIARYAGMSDKLTSFGLYEYRADLDQRGTTAHLIAQMIWCFIEGVTLRKGDYPIGSQEDYLKYIVNLSTEEHNLVFYKSPRSDRWWMDVPYPAGRKNKYERHHLVPCSYDEYQQATNDDMPDRWWRTYQKLT